MASTNRSILFAKVKRLNEIARLLNETDAVETATILARELRLNEHVRLTISPRVSNLEFSLVRASKAVQYTEHFTEAMRTRIDALFANCQELAAAQCNVSTYTNDIGNLCKMCGGCVKFEIAANILVCESCSATHGPIPDNTDNNQVNGSTSAIRTDTDHMKSSLDYLRKLQGHCVYDANAEEIASLLLMAKRDRITARNISLPWFRVILAELKLSRLNDAIPAVMRQHFQILVPQLSEDEEARTAAGMVHDNVIYLQIRSENSHRCNALAYPYNAYRQIDAMFPPGHPKRRLLTLIHLQEAQTLQRHEDDAYHICIADNRKFLSIGAPPRGAFPISIS